MNSYRRVVFFGYRDYLGNVPVILRIGEVSNASDALGRLWRVRYAIVSDPSNPSPTFISRCSARFWLREQRPLELDLAMHATDRVSDIRVFVMVQSYGRPLSVFTSLVSGRVYQSSDLWLPTVRPN
jgi:hypothetical protein